MDSRPYAGARKVHALEEGLEAGVGAEGVKLETDVDIGQQRIAVLPSLLKIRKGLTMLPKP